jgi:hypothetical protein
MDREIDLQINSAVRRVLVRHWIDLGTVSIRTTRGVVSLNGTINTLPGAAQTIDATLLLAIVNEIERQPHVRRLNASFTNWIFTAGIWTSLTQTASSKVPGVAPAAWDINTEKSRTA